MTRVARRTRRALVALLLIAPALAPAGAAAHAQLEATTPAQGAQLDAAPPFVEFRFSEPVNPSLGAVTVFDGRGEQVQAGKAFHPGGRGDAVAVRLPRRLPEGGYTATYRVISADSHPVSGGFSFRIGTGGTAARGADGLLAGSEAGPVTATALGVARGIQYTAIALAAGALALVWLCWLPALRACAGAAEAWRAASAAFARVVGRIWLAAAAAGVVASAAGIALEAAVGAGTSVWRVDGAALGEVLGSRFGITWGLALAAWVVLAVAVGARRARPAVLRPATVGAAGLALGSSRLAVPATALLALCLVPAFGGHAASVDPVAVMLPANLLHVLAISAWAGGVATLALALGPATRPLDSADRPRLRGELLPRFSRLAGAAVAVVLASGVAQSLANLSAPAQLVDTAYGRAVLIKLVLFVVLIGLGAVQRRRVLPALGRGTALRRMLRAEVAVMVVVFGVTGALATYPPGDAAATTTREGPVVQTRTLGPAQGRLTVSPAVVGPNGLVLDLRDRRTGQPWRAPLEVRVTATLPSAGIELPVHTHTNGEGRWTGSGLVLPVAGRWQVAVAARVSDFDEYDATYAVRVP